MLRVKALIAGGILLAAASTAQAGHGHHHCWGGWGGWGGVSYGLGYCYGPPIYGGYPYGYGYSTYYNGYNPYGIYYSPNYGYSDYYLPPVFAPSELLYGPRAVKQFLGISDRPLVVLRVDRDDVDKSKVKVSNPEYRRKADQFIAQGDVLFREQKYSQALDRYKVAIEMAPDLAEAHWRKGHAYVATHRYDLAASAFKRAVALKPDIEREGFTLSKLYGPAATVKRTHLEALAGEALARGDSAEMYFLLGVFLRYDGEAKRAEKFFMRAAELAGRDAAHLSAFLPKSDVVPVSTKELET